MSVIIALYCDRTGETWMACDTLMTMGNLKGNIETKVHHCGPWWIGSVGQARNDSVIRLRAEVLSEAKDIEALAVGLREYLIEDGYRSETKEGARLYGDSEFLVCRPGRIWSICNAFSCDEIIDPQLWAAGTGRELAIGAASVLTELAPDERVLAAVWAAISFSPTCGGKPQAWHVT